MIEPANVTVHWPNGPINVCVPHAEKLIALGRYLGAHVVATPYGGGDMCINCINASGATTTKGLPIPPRPERTALTR